MLEVDLEARVGAFRLKAAFSCETAGIVAVYGRSGAGKTTLVNALAGLTRPKRGIIRLGGKTLFDSQAGIDLRPEKRRLGYVFQEGRLFPHLDVRGNLLYGARRAAGGDSRLELGTVAAVLGLEDLLTRRVHDLSGGEKQRVALGRALLADPELLLMDEPLAALDQERKDELIPFIEALRDRFGVPVVYVSHAMPEILRLADMLVLMSDGQVVASGPVEEITSRLDLRPLTGRYEAGAAIRARIARHDPPYGLTELDFAGGTLRVPLLDEPPGSGLRLRIRARDVALALRRPEDTSFQNIFAARIAEIADDSGPQIDLRLDVSGVPLWARITRRAFVDLGLADGRSVFALVKSVAIDRHSVAPLPGPGGLDTPRAGLENDR